MRILQLSLDHFGKFDQLDLDFEGDMTLVYGSNEAGKSTLMDAFFLAFYGQASNSADVHKNVRRRYIDRRGTEACVTLVFEDQGETFRLQRKFGKTLGQDRVEVHKELTGEPYPLPSRQSPGEVFFGLSADSFLRLLSVNAAGAVMDKAGKDGDQLLDRLINLENTGDEEISFDQVDGLLAAEEKKLSRAHGKSGALPDMIRAIEELEGEKAEAEANESAQAALAQRVKALEAESQELEAQRQAVQEAKEAAGHRLQGEKLWLNYQKKRELEDLRAQTEDFQQTWGPVGLSEDALDQIQEAYGQLEQAQAAIQRLDQDLEGLGHETRTFRLDPERADQALHLGDQVEADQADCQEKQAQVKALEAWVQVEYDKDQLEQVMKDNQRLLDRGQIELDKAKAEDQSFAQERKDNRKEAKKKLIAGTVLSLLGLAFFIYILLAFTREGKFLFWPFLPGTVFFILGWIVSARARDQQLTFYREDDEDLLAQHSRVQEVKDQLIRAKADADHDQARWEELCQAEAEDEEALAALDLMVPPTLEAGQGALAEAVYAREEADDRLARTEKALADLLAALGLDSLEALRTLYQEEAKARGAAEEKTAYRQSLEARRQALVQQAQAEAVAFEDRWGELLGRLQAGSGLAGQTGEGPAAGSKQLLRVPSGPAIKAALAQGSALVRAQDNRLRDLQRLEGDIDGDYRDLTLADFEEQLEAAGLTTGAAGDQPPQILEKTQGDGAQRFADLSEQEKELMAAIHQRESQKMAILARAQERYDRQKNPESLKTEIRHLREQEGELEEDLQALQLSRDLLQQAFNQAQRSFSPQLNRRTSEIFREILGEDHYQARIDAQFNLSLEGEARDMTDWSFLSTGTAEQAYLALRLALADLIDEEGRLPLFLDDVFVYYDDLRAQRTFSFLQGYAHQQGRQILFFTAHDRMLAWAEADQVPCIQLKDEG